MAFDRISKGFKNQQGITWDQESLSTYLPAFVPARKPLEKAQDMSLITWRFTPPMLIKRPDAKSPVT
jgi:hypothetical protein